MELNMKSIVQIGLIILAVMFVMKMMKGKRCEGFAQAQDKPQNVSCNCNITRENFTSPVANTLAPSPVNEMAQGPPSPEQMCQSFGVDVTNTEKMTACKSNLEKVMQAMNNQKIMQELGINSRESAMEMLKQCGPCAVGDKEAAMSNPSCTTSPDGRPSCIEAIGKILGGGESADEPVVEKWGWSSSCKKGEAGSNWTGQFVYSRYPNNPDHSASICSSYYNGVGGGNKCYDEKPLRDSNKTRHEQYTCPSPECAYAGNSIEKQKRTIWSRCSKYGCVPRGSVNQCCNKKNADCHAFDVSSLDPQIDWL